MAAVIIFSLLDRHGLVVVFFAVFAVTFFAVFAAEHVVPCSDVVAAAASTFGASTAINWTVVCRLTTVQQAKHARAVFFPAGMCATGAQL